VPLTLLFLPLSRLITTIGLQDSIWSLVIVYARFTIPLSTRLLMGFLKSVPRDIEEQAQVDGYSRIGAVVRTCHATRAAWNLHRGRVLSP
jgi:multiple sugar transport system permease protein